MGRGLMAEVKGIQRQEGGPGSSFGGLWVAASAWLQSHPPPVFLRLWYLSLEADLMAVTPGGGLRLAGGCDVAWMPSPQCGYLAVGWGPQSSF